MWLHSDWLSAFHLSLAVLLSRGSSQPWLLCSSDAYPQERARSFWVKESSKQDLFWWGYVLFAHQALGKEDQTCMYFFFPVLMELKKSLWGPIKDCRARASRAATQTGCIPALCRAGSIGMELLSLLLRISCFFSSTIHVKKALHV